MAQSDGLRGTLGLIMRNIAETGSKFAKARRAFHDAQDEKQRKNANLAMQFEGQRMQRIRMMLDEQHRQIAQIGKEDEADQNKQKLQIEQSQEDRTAETFKQEEKRKQETHETA